MACAVWGQGGIREVLSGCRSTLKFPVLPDHSKSLALFAGEQKNI
jgi:hypothetical protein